jgi:integrase
LGIRFRAVAQKRRTRGYIEQRASGSYRAVVYAGTDPLTGKPRYLRASAPTWDDAERELTRLLGDLDQERHPKTNITVGQALDQWLDVADLAETTRDRYLDLIRLYIRPTFGNLPAAKLDAELLERFYARLQRCRDLCNGQASRPHVPTASQQHGSADARHHQQRVQPSRALAASVDQQGRARGSARAEPAAPRPPSPEEAARLLSAAWADPDWGLLLWLTMITGRRRGEVCGLRWRHVDFERGQLVVERNIVQPRKTLIEKHTKSGTQPRLALDPNTLALLAEHRERVIERCKALGCKLSPDAFVFSLSPDGSTPYKPRSVSQRYRRLAAAQQLRSTRFHALRHYSATELIAAAVDVRTVAGRLGQSGGGTTTLRVYADWVVAADQRAVLPLAEIPQSC